MSGSDVTFPLPDEPTMGQTFPDARCRSKPNYWACAWHVLLTGKGAYFSDDHRPVTELPLGVRAPESHGICADCYNRTISTID